MQLSGLELLQGELSRLLAEFGMDGGGVDLVFQQLVDDVQPWPSKVLPSVIMDVLVDPRTKPQIMNKTKDVLNDPSG